MSTLNKWFTTPLGKAVAESIQAQFEMADVSIYGDCLQIGTTASILPHHNIFKHTYSVEANLCSEADVIGEIEELPFSDQSFSLVFLPFTLESKPNISKLFNEVDRVLTNDGYILIAGVNPGSLWGLSRLLHLTPLYSKNLKNNHFIRTYSSLYIYTLLNSQGFKTQWIKSFFYRPPFSSSYALKKTRFLEAVGQMFWPYPGGLYLLLAQKKTVQFLSVSPLLKAGGYVFGKA